MAEEQIDAMLSGNLSFDTKKEGDEDEDAGGHSNGFPNPWHLYEGL